ncbi:MAG: chemotaxis protein CheX [Magnetococcales bacterium]|nr:chemotaxis protein CheX [Magnetococcales bacterium]
MSEKFKKELRKVIHDAISETAIAFFHGDMAIENGLVVIESSVAAYVPPRADITAIVGFSGGMEGGIHLSAPMHSAIGLASAFIGEPIERFGPDVRDAMGELTNIVAGSVKSYLSEGIHLSPPNVITGAGHIVEYTATLESTKCYFMIKSGPFNVEVFYRNNNKYA